MSSTTGLNCTPAETA